jgi:hypothetical protein
MNVVEESEELAIWLHAKIDGMAVPNHERSRMATGCFNVVIEHQHAVALLIRHKLYGSAFALARSTYEAYIRGVWLRNCATNQQIQDFLEDKLNPVFSALISDIEKIDGYTEGVLSTVKKENWNLLNSFTHTGFNQVIRRNTDKYIEPNYTDEDIIQIVGFVNLIALLAGVEITFLSGDNELSLEFLEKINTYSGKSP